MRKDRRKIIITLNDDEREEYSIQRGIRQHQLRDNLLQPLTGNVKKIIYESHKKCLTISREELIFGTN